MSFLDSIKEKLSSGMASQQESKWMLSIKEKYEELPLVAQKVVLFTSIGLVVSIFLWIPLSPVLDSQSINQIYSEKRSSISELLKLQTEMGQAPAANEAPPMSSIKAKIDAEMIKLSVTVGQIKEANEFLPSEFPSVNAKGLRYKIEKVTIRQVVDIIFAMEQSDPSIKVQGMDVTALNSDPHFYDLAVKLVSFSPKMDESGGVIDSLKPKKPDSKKPSGKKNTEEET